MFFPFRDNVPLRRTPVVTYGLIAINVATFLWMSRLSDEKQEEFVLRRGFVPARVKQLVDGRPIIMQVPRGQVITPDGDMEEVVDQIRLAPNPRLTLLSFVTCLFLHGGWMHLLGNMWFLWLFGDNVEDRLGAIPYLLFYLCGGIFANACQWLAAPGSTVAVIGASGAVAAILGAYAITWPFARVQTFVILIIFVTILDLPALVLLGFWFLGQLLLALQPVHGPMGDQMVAFWAHVGGFLAGLFLMPWFDELVHPSRHDDSHRDDVIDAVFYPRDDEPQ